MNYFDVWKKMMNAENITDAIVNNGKELITREFRNDPSYRQATLQKLDLSEEIIDIRVKNVDRTTSEKKIIFLPDAKIDVGSFIKIKDKTYLAKEFEDNGISPYSKSILCNQTLNWKGLDEPIPCWCDNSSYGTKGVVESNFLTEYESKILFYTQYNEKTAEIRQDMRFIFDHDENAVYTVVDINRVVTGNVLRLVMDKDEYNKAKDDLENNIAYNNWEDESEEIPQIDNYSIRAYTNTYDISRWSDNKFTIYNGEVEDAEVWDISIDYGTQPNDVVVVKEKTNNSIILLNDGYLGIEIVLKFTKGDVELSQTIRLVK